MKRIHTHYDNLKVARNAPPEVIRAAYKSLSQKYHPDRNQGDSQSTRIMSIINASYEVLSDSESRREHDKWIAQQEAGSSHTGNSAPQQKPETAIPTRQSLPDASAWRGLDHLSNNWPRYVFLGLFFLLIWVIDKPSEPPPGPKPYSSTPAPAVQAYIRPITAPNFQPWPISADYVKDYPRLNTKGLSTVTIDNSQNDSDVFVKLVSLDDAQAYPVRQFYIPAFDSFTLKKVTAGKYDIRYRDLNNGGLSRTEEFSLEEIKVADGTNYSNVTMTLYKVLNGDMQTYELSETEF